MAGTCTLYGNTNTNRGPRFSGQKELIAKFECTDGQTIAGTAIVTANEKVIITGDLTTYGANLNFGDGILPADVDTSTSQLDLSQYENVTLYAWNGSNGETLLLKIYTAPPMVPHLSAGNNTQEIYSTMTVGENAASGFHGWGLEGSEITILTQKTCPPQKISSTGSLIAVTAKAGVGDMEAGDVVKVWLVGERA